MSKIRIYSDIHEDVYQKASKAKTNDSLWNPPVLPNDQDTILVLAGDLWSGTKSITYRGQESFIPKLAKRFKAILIVPGNHDYYGENLLNFASKFEAELAKYHLNNVHLLDVFASKTSIIIDNINYVGSTFWTNMNKHNPQDIYEFDTQKDMSGRYLWNDRNHIRILESGSYKKFNSRHWLSIHNKSLLAIKNEINNSNHPVVLITHHSPLLNSITLDNFHKSDNAFYASDYTELFSDKIILAIHGHMHSSLNYKVNNTTIVTNPVGYPGENIPNFDKNGKPLQIIDNKIEFIQSNPKTKLSI